MTKLNKEEQEKKQAEKHWKLLRFQQGLDVYDDGGEGGAGDFGSAGIDVPLSQEDQALLQRHLTRQENHAKEAKGIIIERTWQLAQGKQNFGNADQQHFSNDKLAHPLLSDKAQFSGAEELSPLADTDNNQERQLQLRQTPEPAPAPAPSIIATPTLKRG